MENFNFKHRVDQLISKVDQAFHSVTAYGMF
ncbi:hypothetical protein A2U01_0098359, partial [Trifolium medium]|nr:hypothetical protein [Trifolium medium]